MSEERPPRDSRPGMARVGRRSPKDAVVVGYLAIELILVAMAGPPLSHRGLFVALHLVLIAGVLALRVTADRRPGRWSRRLHGWYPLVYVPLVFAMLGPLVPAVHPVDHDAMLLDWDRMLFGGHPGVWFDGLASPIGIELLRACWLSYFLFPVAVAVVLWRRPGRAVFEEYVLALVLGWFISYLGYFVVPALGPGYRPDLVPAPAAVNAAGASQHLAHWLFSLEGVKRDIFPSGHTMIALLVLWQAWRHRVCGRLLLVPLVAGLLVATVTLRYHYGVDVVAGAFLSLLIAPITRLWIRERLPERS